MTPPTDSRLAFFLASLLIALSPGPDMLFVVTQSTLHGFRAGLGITLGLCTGLLVHTTAVALGLAALIGASPQAVRALSWAGAAYLTWLSVQSLRASRATSSDEAPATAPGLATYRRGVLMNLTNPKVTLFFLAFLPQFVRPHGEAEALQVLRLGGLFIAATLLAFLGAALASASLGKLARSERVQRALHLLAAFVFLGLALRLAWFA